MSNENLVAYAINDLESLRDSLKEIQLTLGTESAGAVEDVLDHLDEMMETAEGASASLAAYLQKREEPGA